MAELIAGPPPAPLHPPVATEQLRAIAFLRWRILANGFRRKGGAGELIARILVLPLFAAFALLPTLAAAFFSYTFTREGTLEHLNWILWAAFFLAQLLNINLGQPGTAFDPTELIRFPLPLRRFVLIRLLFGLLSPANIVVTLISVAAVAGITLASPRLFFPASVGLLIFSLTNVLFTRMLFAWVDRWLSTRRAREIFTAFLFLGSLGVQALNARFNPGFRQPAHHRHHGGAAGEPNALFLLVLLQRAHPVLTWLPPNLIGDALSAAAHRMPADFVIRTLLCSLFAGAFLWVYTLRMRTEFHGENLSEAATQVPPAAAVSPDRVAAPASHSALPLRSRWPAWLPATLLPLLGKELLLLRRNTGLFYGLVAPAVMVFLFAGRMSTRSSENTSPHWIVLAAVAYALIGVAPMGFNALGLEGTGAQFYFMAPVPLRDVFLAKNLFTLLIAFAETLLVLVITAVVAGKPSASECFFVFFWAFATFLLLMIVGNRRSVSAPRKVNPGRTMKKTQSPLSAYISIGILLGCVAFGFGGQFLGMYLDKAWVGPVLMLAFVAVALLLYNRSLTTIEAFTLEHRDTLFEELGKKA